MGTLIGEIGIAATGTHLQIFTIYYVFAEN
jgi:hypothetical protein